MSGCFISWASVADSSPSSATRPRCASSRRWSTARASLSRSASLRPASPAALDQQPSDQHRLQQEHAEGGENGCPIARPDRRRAEEDLGAPRQSVLGQAPALQLPPVGDQRRGGRLHPGALARPERAGGHARAGDPCACRRPRNPSRHHRRFRRRPSRARSRTPARTSLTCKAGDEVSGIELPSALVPREGREDHDRPRWDVTETVDERSVGPILQHIQLHPVQERGDLVERHREQEGVQGRGPAHHHDALRIRLQRPRQRVCRDKRQRLPPTGHIGGGRRNQRSVRRRTRTRSVRPERGHSAAP